MPTHATSSCDCSLCESVESSAIVQRMAEAARLAKEIGKGNVDVSKEAEARWRNPQAVAALRTSRDHAKAMPKGGYLHPKTGNAEKVSGNTAGQKIRHTPGGTGYKVPESDPTHNPKGDYGHNQDPRGRRPLPASYDDGGPKNSRAIVQKRDQVFNKHSNPLKPSFAIGQRPNALERPDVRHPNALSAFANPKAARDAYRAKKAGKQESALPMGHMIAALENIRTAMEERDFAQYSEAVQTLRGTLYAE